MRSLTLLLPLTLLGCGQEFKQSPYDVDDSGIGGSDDLGAST